jgi:antitoxin (DNA-binding transcriptional repressor) of toxin-antitoxin stability system
MDEVNNKRQPVIITKHGRPVAKLVPIDTGNCDDIFNFMGGKGQFSAVFAMILRDTRGDGDGYRR